MKKSKILLIPVFIFLLVFSCQNVSGGYGRNNSNTQTVSGVMQVSDLLPEEYSNLFSDTDEQERSAFPLKPSITSPTATISAVKAADDSVFTTVDQSDIDYSTGKFVVRNLRLDISYYINISVTVSDTEILKGRSQSFTLTKDNSIKPDMNILLTPIITENKTGNIQLSAEFVSGIKKIKTKVITNTANWPASLENTSSISSGGIFLDITGVPSGAYEILIEFLPQSEAAAPLYVTRQSINVFDGLTTKTWIGDDECISGGKLIVTDALIAKFNSIVDFFVDPVTGRSDNPGTWVAPLKNISEAFDKMNDSAKNYTVNIKSFEEPQIIDRSSVAANSVTIRGDGEGICIDAKKKGAALKINTPSGTTITLENLTLKNGENSSGGGLVIYGKSNVNLGNGVTISGNTATGNGGGVYIYGSNSTTYPTLTINSGAKISGNHVPDDNKGTGIYVDTYARVTLSGGEISGNTGGKNGGGAYIGSTGNFVFNSGEIKNNSATNGGAVYNAGSFTIGGTASIPYGGSGSSNDVYLVSGKTVGISNLSEGSTAVATITPQYFKRGTDILSSSAGALNSNIVNRFNLSQDNDGWNRVIATDYKSAKIDSPIYVVDSTDSGNTRPSGFAKGKPSGANGLKTNPYASITAALGCSELSLEGNTITIAGTVSSQAINSSTSISGSAANVTIEGYKPGNSASTAKIDAKNTANTTALSINKSGLTVTIKNLTITGGNATNGGGINITKGTVVLTDGAVITGNQATNNGGGVYIASDATLYMHGEALIGYNTTTDKRPTSNTLGTDAGKAANLAKQGGGIYNDSGNVYIGCNSSGATSTGSGQTLVSYSLDTNYGVRQNISSSGNGGGIYHAGGNLIIASGTVSYNTSSNGNYDYGGAVYCAGNVTIAGGDFKGNYASNSGGALYIKSGAKVDVTGSVVFSGNTAYMIGGAVCNYGTFTMSAGTIGGDNDSDKNTATSNFGGAVFQNGKFIMSGTAKIPYGGQPKSNDVYLDSGKTIDLSAIPSNTNVATITPVSWTRGKSLVAKDTNFTDQAGNWEQANVLSKFGISDSEWNIIWHDSQVKLDADLYVSGTSANDSNGDGTSSKPYGTLATAVSKCWDSNKPYTIYVKGTLSGNHEISGTINAKSITLQGTGNSPCINAGANGRPLTINTSKEVTVTGLEITNGKLSSGDGGGIKVSGGCTLTLDNGAKITSNDNYTNNTSGKGGGLYIASDSTVIMKGGSLVNLNRANEGGGVYNEGKLLMYGTARIGSTSTTYPNNPWAATPQDPTGNCSYAFGGGVYNKGTICLGYSTWTGPTNNQTSNLSNGITGNFSKGPGGGIYTTGNSELYFNTGNISYNRSSGRGGGVYVDTNASMTMSGGTMTSNCHDGNVSGAIHVNGNLYLSGAAYIPYGLAGNTWYSNGAKNNVYVDDAKIINLTGKLTHTGTVATISTYSAYSNGVNVLKGANEISYSDFNDSLSKFTLSGDTIYGIGYKNLSGTYYGVLRMSYNKANPTTIAALDDNLFEYFDHDQNPGYVFNGRDLYDNYGTGNGLALLKSGGKYYVLLIDGWEQGEIEIEWTVWEDEDNDVYFGPIIYDENDIYLNLDNGETSDDWDYEDGTWVRIDTPTYSDIEVKTVMQVYFCPY